MNYKILSNIIEQFTCIILSTAAFNITKCDNLTIKSEINFLELSDYVTIVITVPETHADVVRQTIGDAGAGKIGNYSYCSYSVKGIGRFMPNKDASPYLGEEGVLEELVEERIEVVCNRAVLEHVIEEIKKVHPYEETIIDIYPVYEIGRKKAKKDM